MSNLNNFKNYGMVFRIYPTEEQKIIISKNSGCSRKVYNELLNIRIEESMRMRDEAELINSTAGTNFTISQLIKDGNIEGSGKLKVSSLYKEFPFLKEKDIDSLALANSYVNLNRAFSDFFKDLKKSNGKLKKGSPQFKKKSYKESYQTNIQGKRQLSMFNSKRYINLPKLGDIKYSRHTKPIGKAKTIKIFKDERDNYYVSCQIENDNYNKAESKERVGDNSDVLGLDVGLIDAVITSDGNKISHKVSQEELRKLDKKVAKYQRMMSRRNFDSQKYHKARKKKVKFQQKIANKVKDSNHKVVNEVLSLSEHFNIENLQVKKMKEGKGNAHSLQHRGLASLLTILEYKAESQGKTVFRVDSYFPSTQLCSECNYQNTELKGKCNIREWVCPECGTKHDRDINAAINIKNYQ